MKLSPKIKNWLMIGGVAVILLVLLYILFSGKLNPKAQPNKNNQSPTATTSENEQPAPQTFSTDNLTANQQAPLDDRGRLEIQLEKKASAFVERWANVSSQDNFSNLTILKNSMTESMITWTDKYIKEQTASKKSDVYIGTEAQAIVAQGTLSSINADSLDITVKVRGQETIATSASQPKTFYQDYKLTLVKSGTTWLADKLTWQDRQYQ